MTNITTAITELKSKVSLQEWQQRILDCRNSGMSIKAWCQQNGISTGSYYFHLRKIRESVLEENQIIPLEPLKNDAHELLHNHITTPLWSGAMLSKNLQKLYIWRYCDYKKDSARFKKLMEYRKACNNIECMKYAEKDTYAAGHFEKMGLSPLYCSDTIGYIPAFKDLLNGTEDDHIREFLQNQKPALLREARESQVY